MSKLVTETSPEYRQHLYSTVLAGLKQMTQQERWNVISDAVIEDTLDERPWLHSTGYKIPDSSIPQGVKTFAAISLEPASDEDCAIQAWIEIALEEQARADSLERQLTIALAEARNKHDVAAQLRTELHQTKLRLSAAEDVRQQVRDATFKQF